MHFIKGEAELKSNGDLCDGKGDKCDSYVKLLIYNSIVFQTNVVKNTRFPTYNEEYTTTGTPLSEYADMEIKMWDPDLSISDDLMDAWTVKPSDIDGTQKTYYGHSDIPLPTGFTLKNSITFTAEWIPACKEFKLIEFYNLFIHLFCVRSFFASSKCEIKIRIKTDEIMNFVILCVTLDFILLFLFSFQLAYR